MNNKRIFYSIDVKCTDEDLFNFVRLKNPEGFQYEYVEDIELPHENNLHPLFEGLGEIFNGNTLGDLENLCKIKTK